MSADTENISTRDYAELRSAGLKAVEGYSHELWTDYNTHDPGVTILEYLCYALTDLGVRTGLPVGDLLADALEAETDPPQFFPAHRVLPCHPVTLFDYRRLLIDIPGVRNAWLETAAGRHPDLYLDRDAEILRYGTGSSPGDRLRIRGFYDARIAFEEAVAEEDRAALLEEARRVLDAHRNLCEVFDEVTEVPEEEVAVCADVITDPEADEAQVMAEIAYALQRFLVPPLHFYSLGEMVEKGLGVEEIFSGPLLTHGFIDEDELAAAEPPTEIRGSDILQVLMDVPGVLAVEDLLVTGYVEGEVHAPNRQWRLQLATGHVPRFSLDKSRFYFVKDGVPYVADKKVVERRLGELRAADRRPPLRPRDLLRPQPDVQHADAGDYVSIQHHFPLNYGIGPAGLPPSADAERQARAAQLKAYLLFFEQILADYLAQLDHISDLFSVAPVERTRYVQAPDDVPGFSDLVQDASSFVAEVGDIAENREEFETRRNRFLDHLLGRYARQFRDYAVIARSLYGAEAPGRLIDDKERLLTAEPDLSQDRARATNIRRAERFQANLSGLEERLSVLLGLSRAGDLPAVIASAFETYEEEDSDHITEYRFRLRDEEGKILLSSSRRAYSRDELRAQKVQVTVFGRQRQNYQLRVDSRGRFYFNLTDHHGNIIARRIEYFESEKERADAIDHVVEFLASRTAGERVYLLEHILLRPHKNGDLLLPVCLDPICPDCAYWDPYSFRLSVILPYWPERFRNMHFRRYLERLVRELTPAHLLPRICWIDRDQMLQFEAAYWQWRMDLAEDPEGAPASRNALVAVWTNLRSVYPPATLHDFCEEPGENPAVLDNTVLGTGDTADDTEPT